MESSHSCASIPVKIIKLLGNSLEGKHRETHGAPRAGGATAPSFSSMKTAALTVVVCQFGRYLRMVEAGQSVRITKHGRPVARLVPDQGFMSGGEAAGLFRGYEADALDRDAAEEVARNIAQLDAEATDALAGTPGCGL